MKSKKLIVIFVLLALMSMSLCANTCQSNSYSLDPAVNDWSIFIATRAAEGGAPLMNTPVPEGGGR